MFYKFNQTVLTQVVESDYWGVSLAMSPQLLDRNLVVLELCYSVGDGVSALAQSASASEQQRVPRGVLGLSSTGGAPPERVVGLCCYNPSSAFQHQSFLSSTADVRWYRSSFGTWNETSDLFGGSVPMVERNFYLSAKFGSDGRTKLLHSVKKRSDDRTKLLHSVKKRSDGRTKLLHSVKKRSDDRTKLLHSVKKRSDDRTKLLHSVKKRSDGRTKLLHSVKKRYPLFERMSKNACQVVDIENIPFHKEREFKVQSLKNTILTSDLNQINKHIRKLSTLTVVTKILKTIMKKRFFMSTLALSERTLGLNAENSARCNYEGVANNCQKSKLLNLIMLNLCK